MKHCSSGMMGPAPKPGPGFVYCFLFLAVMAVLPGCAGPPKHPTWKSSTGAGEFERLMWKAIEKRDWKDVEYHLAPTFAGVTPSGSVLDANGWLDYWKSAKLDGLELEDLRSHSAGADIVVTSVLRVQGNLPSAPANGSFRVISVWQQLKGGWTLTAASLTPLATSQT